ncbi:hypothetical protein ACFL7D_10545 [candidate division KSB1 bacterium]
MKKISLFTRLKADNMKTISKWIFLAAIAVCFSCSESLPVYIEPPLDYQYEFDLSSKFVEYNAGDPGFLEFTFRFRHLFDETLTEPHFRKGTINLSIPGVKDATKQIEFFEENLNRKYYMDPGKWFSFEVLFDHYLLNGERIIDLAGPPPSQITIKASASFQFAKRLNSVKFSEKEYVISFYPPGPGQKK